MRLTWPWVSRAKYEAALAELEAERKRARRRQRRHTAKANAATVARITGLEDKNTATGTLVGWPPYIEPT